MTDDAPGARTVVVRLSEYALSPHDDRLPVLPLVLELHRRQRDWRPGTFEVVPTEEGWRVRLVQSTGREPAGLATAPIGRDV